MQAEYNNLPEEQQSLMKLYKNAVSAKSGDFLTFSAIGGTGDHVSGVDIDAGKYKYLAKPNKAEVQIETVALDDIISSLPPEQQSIFLLKVDVQGHEASVFDGLTESLKAGKMRYILFEYWVDALDQARNNDFGTCSSVKDILMPLVDAGYELFDLSVLAHPKAGNEVTRAYLGNYFRPLNFEEHCKWFASLGIKDRQNKGGGGEGAAYEMGYWTDVLAVYKGDFLMTEVGNELNIQGRRPNPPITLHRLP